MQQITLESTGILRPGELLTLAAFKDRLHLTESAVRSMRLNGLAIRRIGKRHFILSDDVIDYVRKCGKPI